MPTIRIQHAEIPYRPENVVAFEEGLIGLPQLRRMVLVSQPEIAPFLWLAAIDTPGIAFLVLDPRELPVSYAPAIPPQVRAQIGLAAGEEPLLLAIAAIAPDWQRSSINLKAPLLIAPGTMRGAQFILCEREYRLDEPLAALSAAA